MPVEQASFINQLIPTQPQGGESISEGDDHIRTIKQAVKGSFPQVGGAVNATHDELNKVPSLITDVASLRSDVNALNDASHGNVASCYYNPEANPKLVYKYNVADVVADQNGFSTRIVFSNSLPNFDSAGAAHFAFNLTPVSATGNPTLLCVTAAQKDYTGFMAWHLVNDSWVIIPPTECGFSFMCVDMDAGQ
jgi:hypothetical protein